MAKSGQKKAFQEETVQDTLPREELAVHDIADIDYGSTIQGAYNKSSIFFNPQVWSDMQKISEDIHDTRRKKELYEGQYNIELTNKDIEKYRQEFEETRKRELDADSSNRMMMYTLDRDNRIEDAERNDKSVFETVQLYHEEYLQNLDKQYASGEIPLYQYESLRKFATTGYMESAKTAIATDKTRAEARAKYQLGTVTNAYSSMLDAGAGTIKIPQALSELSYVMGVTLPNIKDGTELDEVNKAYNSLILSYVTGLSRKVGTGEADSLTVEEFKSQAEELLSQFSYYDWHFVKDIATGDTVNIPCTVTPETRKAITSLYNQGNNSGQEITAVWGGKQWSEMVGLDKIKAGKFDEIEYLSRATISTADEDAGRALGALWACPSKESQEQAANFTKDYVSFIRPAVLVKEVLTSAVNSGMSLDQAKQEIRKQIRIGRGYLNDPNNDLSNISLIVEGANGVSVDLGIPSEGTNALIDRIYRPRGVDSRNARYNILKNKLDTMEKLLDSSNTSDLLISVNPRYKQAIEGVKQFMAPESGVVTNTDLGIVAPNKANVPRLAEAIKQANTAQGAIAGTRFVNPQSKDLLTYAANVSKNMDVKSKAAYYKYLGMGMVQAKSVNLFSRFQTDSLTKDQKEVAEQATAWAYIESLGDEHLSNLVMANMVGGEYPNPNIWTANNLLKDKMANGKMGVSFSDQVEQIMNDYHVPAEYRPYMRKAIALAGVSSLKAQEGKVSDAEFDMDIAENIVKTQFSKEGTFKNGPGLGSAGISVEQADSYASGTRDIIGRALKRLGIDSNDLNVRFNADTGKLEITSGGFAYNGIGNDSRVPGTGVVPFQLDVTNKPADMDEGKYIRTLQIEAATMCMLQVLASPETNAKVLKLCNKYKVDPKELQQTALSILWSMSRPDNQTGNKVYRNANYGNMVLSSTVDASIPKIMQELMMEVPFGQSDSSRLRTQMGDVVGPTKVGKFVADMAIAGKEAVTDVASAGKTLVQKNIRYWMGEDYSNVKSRRERRADEIITQDELTHSLNYYYNATQGRKSVGTAQSVNTAMINEGIPYPSIRQTASDNGWLVTSGYRSPKPGVRTEHDKGLGVDLGAQGGFYRHIGSNGLIKLSSMESFINIYNQYKPIVTHIYTSRPELLQNKPEYAAYKKYRAMKAPDGKPLFREVPNKSGWGKHGDHMHMGFKQQVFNPDGSEVFKGVSKQEWVQRNATLMTQNCTGYIRPSSAKQLINQWPTYKPNEWDAKNCGRSLQELQSPGMAGVALGQRYLAAQQALGITDPSLVWAALAGAKFRVEIQGVGGIFNKRNQGGISYSLKQPTELLTLEQVVNFSKKMGSAGSPMYRFYLPDSERKKPYVQKVLQSAKKVGY